MREAVPELATLDPRMLVLSLASGAMLLRFHCGVHRALAVMVPLGPLSGPR